MTFPRIQWAVFCLVFFGVPILLVLYEYREFIRASVRDQRTVEILDMEKSVISFENELEVTKHLDRVLLGSTRKILTSENPRETFLEVSRELKGRFPKVLEFMFIDGNGKLYKGVSPKDGSLPANRPDGDALAGLSDLEFPPDIVGSFWQDALSHNRGDREKMKANVQKYKPYFGPLFGKRGRVNLIDSLDTISYRTNHTYYFSSATFEKGMILVFINRLPEIDEMSFKNQAIRTQEKFPRSKIQIIDLRNPINPDPRHPSSKYVGKALARLGNNSGKIISLGNFIWSQSRFSRQLRCLFAFPDNSSEMIKSSGNLSVIFGLVLFTALSFFSIKYFSHKSHLFISLKLKLALLFFYVVGISLGLLVISSNGFLREKGLFLETQLFDRQEKALTEFDRRFLAFSGTMGRAIRGSLSKPFSTEGEIEKIAGKKFSAIHSAFQPEVCELIDEKGQSKVRSKVTWEGETKNISSLIQNSTSSILREVNQSEENLRANAKDQLVSMTAEIFGVNIDLIFSIFTQSIGTLRSLKIANAVIHLLLHPIRDMKGKARFLAVFLWRDHLLERQYLEKKMRIFRKKGSEFIFLAKALRNERIIPADSPFKKFAVKFQEQIQHQVLPLKSRFKMDGLTYLITGLKGKNLGNFSLFAITSDREIRREVQWLGFRNFLLSLTLLFISFSVGGMLSSSFLEPIKDLSTGVNALQNRQFETRIPVHAGDELGDLAFTFNEMIEGMADLEIARVVQDNFFPSEKLSKNGWNFFGSCVSASRVGGDYFDYFPIDDNRIAVIIGDVSGHGVSAALVVAMAKALIANPANRPAKASPSGRFAGPSAQIHPTKGDTPPSLDDSFDPGEILGNMQVVFSQTLKRKKMMSCLFGLFDTCTGTIILANAGHGYPYLVKDGKADLVKVQGPLLGVKSSLKNYKTVNLALNPEDSLIFYTDGYIEALDEKGAMLGFDRVTEHLPSLVKSDSMETEKALRQWHSEVVMPGPLADDITLVVLQHEKIPI